MSGSDILGRITVEEKSGRAISDAATGEVIGYAPLHTAEDLDAAIRVARETQPSWEAAGSDRRATLMNDAAKVVEDNLEELARILSREQGKPLNGPNARSEIQNAATWLRATAGLTLEPEVVLRDGDHVSTLHYFPAGVVGAIGPWNWPVMISVWQIAASLRVGNTVVLKPSSNTPLSVLALGDVLNQVLPAGVLQVITGRHGLSERLISHPDIDKLMFTGSTETGRAVIRGSADNLARVTVELGGNDAGIVLPDAEPEAIAADVFWGAFLNTGQTCAALKRLYVHESIYERMVSALAKIASETPMGVGLDERNLLGPLQNKKQFDIVSSLVEDAKRRGARIVTGGEPAPELGKLFYRATIVADIDDGAPLVDEEQFGPVLPVIPYSDVDDAVRRANGLDVGLGGSVWSSDPDRAEDVALRLHTGTVWINSHGGVNPLVPFGGVKSSGYGLEFGVEGLKAVSVQRVISR